ncbi:Class I SAM-dependent methyltransferase [Rhodovastum atsumiense]|uniref:Class I SAM-dependent methyltransferase n=1 Tax=Rhodovastum atsumiense TaxID=504468 RepID=A0A5M6ITH3_9PROT|nr:class I SAM-dependent methyltransferase [Rhodovastum atsumiense]KAA5610848.1 class I SAM-dependent methyltransferase [Rhodovastum atsumiense]CAH2602100.1 Class I SAM-dependent methyltransferase [Rhodovastum atsumiense]
MRQDASDGWNESAAAWIEEQSPGGDYGRRYVLDAPMLARIRGRGFVTALDVGCGEGRFCRMMQSEGLRTVGIDPTEPLLWRARQLDAGGDYRLGRAETLDVADGEFDLVVSYLTLIDIPDLATALRRMVAVLRPGGTLLIANLTSFNTAGMPGGWIRDGNDEARFCIDHYLQERAVWLSWRGISIRNWHRPLGTYMGLLLEAGMLLRYFAEPEPHGGDPQHAERYRRVPYFHIMEWEKPLA